ncbi:MAG: ABC transporter ATP-binding protein [Thermoplasmata archaeon]|nr:ABC transporter ATP-binding protein [Thermoplasmata archaeon]HHH78228.1 ABC transporter ATP-binding protein [Thermoplasmatales archaeon]
MGILELKNLSLTLNGKKILNDLNIDFWEGHVHAVVGPNGAGKSTLAYTIMGLEGYRKIEGDIIFEGESIKEMKVSERAKKGLTLGWQEPARYEGLSVKSFIMASAGKKSIDEVEDALKKVGLAPEYMERAVDKTLSGGERKKIELASILAMKPRFVMLDEPDSGIDVASLEKIFEGIKLLRSYGSTVVLITHSLAVMKQAEHGFLMCGGKLVEKGSIGSIEPYFERECLPCEHKNVPDMGDKNGS